MAGLTIDELASFCAAGVAVLLFVSGYFLGALRERRQIQSCTEALPRRINVLELTIDDLIDLHRKTSRHIKAVEWLVWTPPSGWPSKPPSEWPPNSDSWHEVDEANREDTT